MRRRVIKSSRSKIWTKWDFSYARDYIVRTRVGVSIELNSWRMFLLSSCCNGILSLSPDDDELSCFECRALTRYPSSLTPWGAVGTLSKNQLESWLACHTDPLTAVVQADELWEELAHEMHRRYRVELKTPAHGTI